jgi:hypothetical protein
MSEENTEGGIETPLGKLSFKGKKTAEFITVLTILLSAALLALYWRHSEDTTRGFELMDRVAREQVGAIKEQAQATRYMSCIISENQEDRKIARAECREQARMP